MSSMYAGVDEIADEWLTRAGLDVSDIGSFPHYKHETTLNDLALQQAKDLDGSWLIGSVLQKLEENWQQPRHYRPAKANWVLRSNAAIAKRNESPEVTLERKITKVDEWYNQIPTCASLLDSNSDSHCNIDLALTNAQVVTYIELKIATGTPLSAAIQIIRYGLMFAFSRRHAQEIGYNQHTTPALFQYGAVQLRVLAPLAFYKGYRKKYEVLDEIANKLNAGLQGLATDKTLPAFSFQFWSFPPEFRWPSNACDSETIRNALEAIAPLQIIRRTKQLSEIESIESTGLKNSLGEIASLKKEIEICPENLRLAYGWLKELLREFRWSPSVESTEGWVDEANRCLRRIRSTLQGRPLALESYQRFVKLRRSQADAKNAVGRIDSDQMQRMIQNRWDADEDGYISSQFVCRLICCGTAPNEEIASQVRSWFDNELCSEMHDVTFAHFMDTVGKAKAEQLRDSDEDIEGEIKRLLAERF